MLRIDPARDLIFYPLKDLWVVRLPDGATKPFPGGWAGRRAAEDFIAAFNASAVATA